MEGNWDIQYVFKMDNDFHWYLIPFARVEEFDNFIEKDDEDAIAVEFGEYEINDVSDFYFNTPYVIKTKLPWRDPTFKKS